MSEAFSGLSQPYLELGTRAESVKPFSFLVCGYLSEILLDSGKLSCFEESSRFVSFLFNVDRPLDNLFKELVAFYSAEMVCEEPLYSECKFSNSGCDVLMFCIHERNAGRCSPGVVDIGSVELLAAIRRASLRGGLPVLLLTKNVLSGLLEDVRSRVYGSLIIKCEESVDIDLAVNLLHCSLISAGIFVGRPTLKKLAYNVERELESYLVLLDVIREFIYSRKTGVNLRNASQILEAYEARRR